MIDKELMEKLSKWENVFNNAIKLNFIHLSASEFGEIANLYKAVFGKTLTKSQMSCNSCRLRSLKELAKEYFKEKEKDRQEKEKREKERIERERLEKEKQENKPKPKRGRPKKINIDGEIRK